VRAGLIKPVADQSVLDYRWSSVAGGYAMPAGAEMWEELDSRGQVLSPDQVWNHPNYLRNAPTESISSTNPFTDSAAT